MRNLLIVGLVLALAGCGGYDDIDAMRDATMGSTSVVGGNTSSNSDNTT